ncbi:MAG: transcription-repair coupling factor [Robiginitomaculum sp.]|nr:MAG: transcription-repair coupling factor [Robiginitomaculum sp.]
MSVKPVEMLARFEGALKVGGATEGLDALACANTVRLRGGLCAFIATDEVRATRFAQCIRFFDPDLKLIQLPGWDCLPYDRVSPSAEIAATRAAALAELAAHRGHDVPVLVVTTINSLLQRIPPVETLAKAGFFAKLGDTVSQDDLLLYLQTNGYARAANAVEPGDFAVRGGVVDIFAPASEQPVRLDFFGDVLDGIRSFDPLTQRSTSELKSVNLTPVSEVLLGPEQISRFRREFVASFGAVHDGDPIYDAVSAGARPQGVEHWLPLFYEQTDTLLDVLGAQALLVYDHLAEQAFSERQTLIRDYYEARKQAPTGRGDLSAPQYRALAPAQLYLDEEELATRTSSMMVRHFAPFIFPPADDVTDLGGREGRNFSLERQDRNTNVFDVVGQHVDAARQAGKQVMIACLGVGSKERLAQMLRDHGVQAIGLPESWAEANSAPKTVLQMVLLPLETGFETDTQVFLCEQDIFGDRLGRGRRKRRAKNFISEAGSLHLDDLVVHADHGIGRYVGLRTLDVHDAPHDCLELEYAGGDRLFLPVENIELLSRYGSDSAEHKLDRLGGAGWQSRKAKAKKRLLEMAGELIRIAAARELKTAEKLTPPEGAWEEFCARFPYTETDDQLNAIVDVLDDMAKGRPMDRLICGDVGFGKTEVALRAAFVAALSGRQVAIIAPTTLLARQHFATFCERFRGWPVKVRQLSRLVPAKQAAITKKGMRDGQVDIVIGTHALLADTIKFRDLGLMIIDEEQRFGVKHKERLKSFRANVHVLTLTATPIPRTLQMALSGIRELSLIATPPVDRLAIRTYVSPFDPVTIREALLRERFRGGQSFVVVPRIADLDGIEEFLREDVPEVRFVVAHGQMPPRELEDIMTAFYEGKYDVLVSTTIIESGLDIPTANTLVVVRADRFGLAQLYQLRGRVGRSKVRAYAYLTTPNRQRITKQAEQRLRVLSSLDSLGAGFTLASHDLDIRGGGNLLGDEQSGQIRDVGVELYQSMLEEAVSELKSEGIGQEDHYSPQISTGVSVLIPENYVSDLDVRLSLYRRLANLDEEMDREEFAAELIDRFGPLPEEVEHLLLVMRIKADCLRAGIEKIDAGPKGVIITFRKATFAEPRALFELVSNHPSGFKMRPDHKLVIRGEWPEPPQRLQGAAHWARQIAGILPAPQSDD